MTKTKKIRMWCKSINQFSEVNGEVCEEEYVLGTSRVIEAHILWGRDPPAVSEWLTHITLVRVY